jgi:hypothetical protein
MHSDWHAQSLEGELLTAAQFGVVLSYICKGGRHPHRAVKQRAVCVDRKLIDWRLL